MEKLKLWARTNPRRIGRLLILLGLVVAGYFTHREDAAVWQDYTMLALEKISVPHGSHTYRLKTATAVTVKVEYADLFNKSLLMHQTLPVAIQVFAEPESKDDSLEAQGLRLKSGEIILDPDQVREKHLPQRTFGMVFGGILLFAGVLLQFKRTPVFTKA